MCIRTEKVNEEFSIPTREKVCKSIAVMVFECYFFNQLLHCNVGMAYIRRNDDVSFTRVNKRIILSRRKTTFRTKFLIHRSHGSPVLT